MDIEVPFTTRPDDVSRLLESLPGMDIPVDKVDSQFFKTQSFSISSDNHLIDILKKIGFIDNEDKPSTVMKTLKSYRGE